MTSIPLLGTLLETNTSLWQEQFAAIVFLSNWSLTDLALVDFTYQSVASLVNQLNSLPENWARELCLETLSVNESRT